ncbi:hypothetical protein ACQ4PT_031413 [Festuca glaucescens]
MGSGPRSLDCRSFWKAGAFEAPSVPAREFHDALETGDFDRARVHPKFLHTNATSHKWAFGGAGVVRVLHVDDEIYGVKFRELAIAELLDNAVDEISNGATYVKVDKIVNSKDNSPMLVFQDDGGGMDPEGVRKCMSLGFSTKKSKTTIGQYGNGFKTSTMRLGADAVVFTRAIRGSNVTLSVGLLSYTFLRKTVKDDIVVPMVISIFKTKMATSYLWRMVHRFEDIDSHGTKVVIYNLWMNDDGLLELDFDDDDEAYTSILYLKKYENFQIILRGKPVEHISVANDLKFKKVVTYKPQVTHDSQVPYWKVLQEGSSRGRSVVGVLEANFIEPAHDKQDFERTPLFIRLETKLRQIIIDYWKERCHLIGYQPMDPQVKSQYKDGRKDSGGPGPKVQQKSSTDQRIGRRSSNLLPETYDDAAAMGLTANGAGFGRQFFGQAQENSMNSAGLEEDLVETGSHGVLDPNFVEKLSEENISLFTRHEELRQRDTQLKQTIGQLEHELEETKRKCSQLSTELQARKSQQQLPYMRR